MTDITSPAEADAALNNSRIAQSVSKAGGHDGYIVDGVDISEFYTELDATGVNGFVEVSQSGLDLTLDGGEAFLYGWLCRDRQTTVSLPSDSSGTVYAGYNADATLPSDTAPNENDNIIVGLGGAFSDKDPRLPLYDFVTGSSSIDSTTDVRDVGRVNADSPWIGEGGGVATGQVTVDSDEYEDHFRAIRSGVGDWVIGPTTNAGDSIEFAENDSGVSFYFGTDGEIYADGDNAVKSPSETMIFVQSSEPSNASDGDIWIDNSS